MDLDITHPSLSNILLYNHTVKESNPSPKFDLFHMAAALNIAKGYTPGMTACT
jgi:hypothetical protein